MQVGAWKQQLKDGLESVWLRKNEWTREKVQTRAKKERDKAELKRQAEWARLKRERERKSLGFWLKASKAQREERRESLGKKEAAAGAKETFRVSRVLFREARPGKTVPLSFFLTRKVVPPSHGACKSAPLFPSLSLAFFNHSFMGQKFAFLFKGASLYSRFFRSFIRNNTFYEYRAMSICQFSMRLSSI